MRKPIRLCLLGALVGGLILSGYSQEADEEYKKRLDILRYGIETQVLELVNAIKSEKNADFSKELLSVFDSATSPRLRSAILDYYGHLELKLAVSRASDIIAHRDETADSLVGSAFTYLVGLKSSAALDHARRIIEDDERKYLGAAIKLLGVAGEDDDVPLLRSLYESSTSTAGTKQEILLAFGKMRAKSSFDLLASIAAADDAGKIERMYACTALGDLGDPRAVPVLVKASVSSDPNVRANALIALQNFEDKDADNAILQGLRDQHVIPRAAAIRAAEKRRLRAAIPFLEFRIKSDPERSIKDAAITALASIGGKDGLEFLTSFLEDAKSPLAHRAHAFTAIMSNGGPEDIDRIMKVLQAAAGEKDRALFLALARAAMATSAPQAVIVARFLLSDTDHLIRLGAVAWAERNKASELLPELEALADSDPVETLRKRVVSTIERIRRP